MIITRTPLRISLAGGGTDLPEFYETEIGAVTSTAISKYVYIIVVRRFDESIRVSYSKTEIVDSVDEIQHPIVREAMMLAGVTKGVEIVSVADVPAGTGLGSSSSFTVGLLNALYAYKGVLRSPSELASEACRIEMKFLREPIGKQDQYIAAYGGIRHIRFQPDDTVVVEHVLCAPEIVEELGRSLLLLYTGRTQEAKVTLEHQRRNTNSRMTILRELRDLAVEMREWLRRGDLEAVGKALHEGWQLKKQLADGISDPQIDDWYDRARKRGAIGGKVLGAGGRGFLLLCCPVRYQQCVLDELNVLRPIPFGFESEGSRLIYVGGDRGE
jgi:D-glycero-alpha-D-manno-heptose-7-phosphate kinase